MQTVAVHRRHRRRRGAEVELRAIEGGVVPPAGGQRAVAEDRRGQCGAREIGPVEATADERMAYLKRASQLRNQVEDAEDGAGDEEESASGNVVLTDERFNELAMQEDFLLAVTSRGFGKRTSAYEYRTTGRGGSGIWNMKLSARNGEIVCSYNIKDSDEVMLVTNGGQIIRMPVGDVRFVGRQTQGVTLFRIEADEQVVSAAVIRDAGEGPDTEGNE